MKVKWLSEYRPTRDDVKENKYLDEFCVVTLRKYCFNSHLLLKQGDPQLTDEVEGHATHIFSGVELWEKNNNPIVADLTAILYFCYGRAV